jgi:hypothetical protein
MRLVEARELVDLLDRAGRHDRAAELRLERWLRARAIRTRPTGWPDRGRLDSWAVAGTKAAGSAPNAGSHPHT